MSQTWDILITASTIVSLILVIFIFIYPLNEHQILVIYIFDFAVVVLLVIDFCIRVKASPQKRKYIIRHWYEFPAMVPLALLGFMDTVTAANYSLLSFKLLTIFRTVRLFETLCPSSMNSVRRHAVAYGEFYPVTFFGKTIATVVMFAAIGILWTLVALVTSTVIDKKIKKAQVGLVDEAKTVIKNRIDEVEKLSEDEIEVLITMIRSLSKQKSGK